ncbi:MAG: GAF domain-containing protein [Anaerolineae bacterium]|nr:GAF domain-containing protein [Anaerolineae bacterium]
MFLDDLQRIAVILKEPDVQMLSERLCNHLSLLLNAPRVLVCLPEQNRICTKYIFEQGELMTVHDSHLPDDQDIVWVMFHRRTYHHVGVSLVTPVLNHQEHLLAIIACYREGASFTPSEIALLETIAQLAVSAFERTQMFEKMTTWNRSFENLLTFKAALNAQVSSGILLQRLVKHGAGFLGARSGFAALLKDGRLHTAEYWCDGIWHPFQMDWAAGSIPDYVRNNECPYLVEDYPADSLADSSLVKLFHVRSAICVPIVNSQDQVMGCVELHNKHGGQEAFTWSDIAFLESLSNSTAVVLDNARLLQELEQQRVQLKALSAHNINLMEEERQRIARELHDESGQILIGIKLGLQVLRHKIPAEHIPIHDEIDQLCDQINQSTIQLKSIAQALRPPILDELGLEAALRQLAGDFDRRCGIPAQYKVVKPIARLSSEVETACYRIVQEALTNIARHAHANRVVIAITHVQSVLEISIRDNGCGFVTTCERPTSLGLLGMQERAITLGGELQIESQPGKGTQITVRIPV